MAIEFVRNVRTRTNKPNGRCFFTRHYSKYSRALRLVVHVLLLAVFLVVYFPWMIRSTLSKLPSISDHEIHSLFNDLYIGSNDEPSNYFDVQTLNMVFQDLKNEGLFQARNDKAVFVTAGSNDYEADIFSQIINDNEMDIVSVKDSERQSSIPNDTLGFAFASNFPATAEFVDRTLKLGGVVSFKLGGEYAMVNELPSYKIIYLRRFGKSTFIAMRKTLIVNDRDAQGIRTKRRQLLGINDNAKRAALENLENVLLEPPRAASGKSRRYLKRTRFLPELMGEYPLERYPRRVFIHVVGGDDVAEGEWLARNYPTRDTEFEVYEIEMAAAEAAEEDLTRWLERSVREEEYVVMKAEADVAEEIVRTKAVRLVDELFLECKPHHSGGGKRAYWECLALYGRLRDEGVAVHQWWG